MEICSGSTISGVMILKDENNAPITDLTSYDIKMLIRNRYDDYQILLQKEDLTIKGSEIRFTFSAESTKELKNDCIFELKVTNGENVKIAQESMFYVKNTKIKDL